MIFVYKTKLKPKDFPSSDPRLDGNTAIEVSDQDRILSYYEEGAEVRREEYESGSVIRKHVFNKNGYLAEHTHEDMVDVYFYDNMCRLIQHNNEHASYAYGYHSGTTKLARMVVTEKLHEPNLYLYDQHGVLRYKTNEKCTNTYYHTAMPVIVKFI